MRIFPSIGRIARSSTRQAMTLIVGVRCEDGVVVGADSISTYFSSGGRPTIEQEVGSKIDIFNCEVLVATAGSVGMSQLVKAELHRKWTRIGHDKRSSEVRDAISELIWQQLRPSYRRSGDAKVVLQDERIAPPYCATLLAAPVANEPRLLRFDHFSNATEYTLDLPIVSLGSGQEYADPFLAFIKRAIWQDSAPKRIADGITGVLWTLQHVNQVNAGAGVGGKPTIAVLHKPGNSWIAEELHRDIVDAHRLLIEGAEAALIDYLRAEESSPESFPIPLPSSPAGA